MYMCVCVCVGVLLAGKFWPSLRLLIPLHVPVCTSWHAGTEGLYGEGVGCVAVLCWGCDCAVLGL